MWVSAAWFWFFFPLMASVTLSPENIVNKIQEALRYHKSGNFDEAIRLYDEVIPLVTGKVASQLCGNAGALYLQQGSFKTVFFC
jgi:hypothetical protein